ncbi:DUF6597 domain-containing transcriptional factor [Nonomuraea sp. NPDC050663]|uniref:AraC family transcriptional regulator n=1 Tax=Nonomuraea sp. NPDC050663 TaxID=3364370 RepID=UPI00379427FC
MATDARGLGGAWRRFQRHDEPGAPSADLAPFVDRYWAVTWHYREPYQQLIVPYPNVHLTFRDGGAWIQGVCRGHQVRVLEGRGGVFGVAFRPGGFRPFLGTSVSTITDRVVPAAEILPGALPHPVTAATVEEWLRARLPEPDPRAERAAAVVALIAGTPEITRVDVLARRLDTGVREVQRLFADYVGIGPKWVIRRYRLHEVTERLARGMDLDWAGVAAELGYADQAHFTRDFKDMFGEPPTAYAERY